MAIQQLEPTDDLDAALRTISEFNRIIGAADTKIGFLLTANGFGLMGLVTAGRTPTHLAITIMGIALEVTIFSCMCYLAMALRPNLYSAGAGNWFCFPTFPIEVSQRPTPAVLADYAWQQTAALAAITQRKYRRFEVALRWSAFSLVIFLIWFAISLLRATSA
ncbi:hypothetical protein [Nocardia sp. NPDC127526]|uniref:hypothetical protein n=1 Tax=Nocardia sp. NPDC127526 TaxID=3345393 RepID=UPI00362B746F